MNDASSEQRKRTAPATSFGSPSRPSGVLVSIAAGQLLGDRAADALRGAGDEGALALEAREAHASDRSSGSRSSASTLFTETVLTLLSIRLTSPERTLPGPTSTKVRTPSRTSSVADCVK